MQHSSGLIFLLRYLLVVLIVFMGLSLVFLLPNSDRIEPDIQLVSNQLTTEYSRPGGDATIDVRSKHAFGKSVPNLSVEQLQDFAFGNRLFNTNWVTAPASVKTLDGLGPLFNRVSCSGCHTRDGRGMPPEAGKNTLISTLIRISVADGDKPGPPKEVPNYGGQLQNRGIRTVKPEADVIVNYKTTYGYYADGEQYELREPVYVIFNGNYGPLPENMLISPRLAQQVNGLGLIDAIDQKSINAWADPDDKNRDGISGKVNWVWSSRKKTLAPGRYGWKAEKPTVEEQSAAAFAGDIGITSPLNQREPLSGIQQKTIDNSFTEHPELSQEFLDKVTFYIRTLAVPARRNPNDPKVLLGERVFKKINCHACHRPTFKTGVVKDVPQLSEQTIHPFTDLLLHDMGEGLADNRPTFQANGREWRTPPLWGLGLVETVNGKLFLLHDGRARTIAEAILWHGGEAEKSKQQFLKLSKEEREALVKFLLSL